MKFFSYLLLFSSSIISIKAMQETCPNNKLCNAVKEAFNQIQKYPANDLKVIAQKIHQTNNEIILLHFTQENQTQQVSHTIRKHIQQNVYPHFLCLQQQNFSTQLTPLQKRAIKEGVLHVELMREIDNQ